MPIRDLKHTRFGRSRRKGGTPSFSPTYETIYGNWLIKPSNADAIAQDTLFVSPLVAAGIWAKRQVIQVFASHASGIDSLRNWKNSADVASMASLVNNPAFALYEGYTGNGINSYVDTKDEPDGTGLVKYDDNCFISYCRNNISDNTRLFGMAQTIHRTMLIPRHVTDYYSCQDFATVGSSSADGTSLDARGFYSLKKNISTTLTLRRNGVLVLTDNALTPQTTYPSAPYYYLAEDQVNGVPRLFSTRQGSLYDSGSYLTDAEDLIYRNAFQALMTYYGTQV